MISIALALSIIAMVISIAIIVYPFLFMPIDSNKANATIFLGVVGVVLTLLFGFGLFCSCVNVNGSYTEINRKPDEIARFQHSIVAKYNGRIFESDKQIFYEQDTNNIVIVECFGTNSYGYITDRTYHMDYIQPKKLELDR